MGLLLSLYRTIKYVIVPCLRIARFRLLEPPFPRPRMIADRSSPSRVRRAASRPGPPRADPADVAVYEGKGDGSRRPPAQSSECARRIRASSSIAGTGLMSVSPPATTRVYSRVAPRIVRIYTLRGFESVLAGSVQVSTGTKTSLSFQDGPVFTRVHRREGPAAPRGSRARTHGTTISQPTWPGVPDRLHPAHGAGTGPATFRDPRGPRGLCLVRSERLSV